LRCPLSFQNTVPVLTSSTRWSASSLFQKYQAMAEWVMRSRLVSTAQHSPGRSMLPWTLVVPARRVLVYPSVLVAVTIRIGRFGGWPGTIAIGWSGQRFVVISLRSAVFRQH
jgi:hypothetical protein